MDSADKQLSIALRVGRGVDKYPAKSHARRVAAKLAVSRGTILLFGTDAATWPSSDMPGPFRQDRNMYYLSGCNEPGTRVTYDIERDWLTLWLPEIDEDMVVWYGRGSTVEEALEKYDVDHAEYIRPSGSIWTSVVDQTDLFCLHKDKTPVNSRRLRTAIDACRVIKDDYEIRLIRTANEISSEAHKEVMKKLHKLRNEAEVEAFYMKVCIARQAKTQAYDPIVGAGPNAGILHYSANTADFGKGQTLVIDAGCEVERYASDVTRTLPLNPENPGTWPSEEARNVYNLVEKVQEACIDAMRPGADFDDISSLADDMIVDGLLELGVLKGDRDSILDASTYRGFYPHGLGHHVGLDVHDVSPDPHPYAASVELEARLGQEYVRLLSTTGPVPSLLVNPRPAVLEPGMVVTIEPGVYFNRYLLGRFFLSNPRQSKYIDKKVLEQYMSKVGGVRIEDCILITKDGYENLTPALKGKSMLEYIQNAARDGHRTPKS